MMSDDHKEVIFEYSKPADKFLRKHEDIREDFEDSIMKIYKKFRG